MERARSSSGEFSIRMVLDGCIPGYFVLFLKNKTTKQQQKTIEI